MDVSGNIISYYVDIISNYTNHTSLFTKQSIRHIILENNNTKQLFNDKLTKIHSFSDNCKHFKSTNFAYVLLYELKYHISSLGM